MARRKWKEFFGSAFHDFTIYRFALALLEASAKR
jgi:hypothetical protein